MISAGNDVVSLADTDIARTITPSFYKKILSVTEIERYEQEYNPFIPLHHYIWLCWSAKESAYKYLKRHDHHLVFSPTKFVVFDLAAPSDTVASSFDEELNDLTAHRSTAWYGAIQYHSTNLYFQGFLFANVLHTVVSSHNNFAAVCWGLQKVNDSSPGHLSYTVRELALTRINTVINGTGGQICKNDLNIPSVKTAEYAMPISLSHHGHYVAYAFNYQ